MVDLIPDVNLALCDPSEVFIDEPFAGLGFRALRRRPPNWQFNRTSNGRGFGKVSVHRLLSG
jgi:hypothetical protein